MLLYTTGSEFYLGFVPNFGVPPTITMLTSSDEVENYSVEALVTGFYQSGNVTANFVQNTITLPITLTGPSRNIPNDDNNAYKEGIHIQANRNQLIVIGSTGSHTFDTYFALPTVNLCLEEYLYFAVSVNTMVQSDGSVVIVGTADQTTVNITVPVIAFIKMNNSTDWVLLARQTLYSYEIQRLQILYISAFMTDLTGTKVTSNKPISLFSGHECAFVPSSTRNCDSLIEQIPPTELWGTVYYYAPLARREGYTIKIMAAYDSTFVEIYCNDTVSRYFLNAGMVVTWSYYSQQYCEVSANQKLLVAQLGHSYESDNSGDAMLTLIPPTAHYTNHITTSVVRNSYSNPKHYINIVVLPSYYQPEMISIRGANGTIPSLSSYNWVPIRREGIITAYATQVDVTALLNFSHSVFEVVHANNSALMTIISYGFMTSRAYGHPGYFKSALNSNGMLLLYLAYTKLYVHLYLCKHYIKALFT